MTENKTKSFVLEFETGLTKKDRDLCEKKLRIGRSMYNAFLDEALKRYNGYQNDERFKTAVKLYRDAKEHKDKEEMKALGDIMNQVKREYGWNGKYSLSDFRKQQSEHFRGAIGSMIAATLAQRAYHTVEKMEKGHTDRINFVRKDDDFSIEGSTNDNGVIYRNGRIYFDIRKDVFVDIKPARRNDEEYYSEALQNRVKYCRLLSRTIRGKKRYYIHLVMEETPPNHRIYGDGKIEILDVKISHVELKKENEKSEIIELAPGCRNPEEKIAEIDRRMDASRRATNPDNYNEDGTVKKGINKWAFSNNYRKLAARRKEIYRSMAARRKVAHEELTNRILAEGTDITIRHLSYKEQQQRSKKETEINPNTGKPYSKSRQGKNIANRAPSEFVSILSRKLNYIDKAFADESKENRKDDKNENKIIRI